MKVNAYICVDKDGTEKITNSMPLRRKFEGIRLLDVIVGFIQVIILKIIGINGVMNGQLMRKIAFLFLELFYQKEQ